MTPTAPTPREIADVQELLGDLLATGHTVEDAAGFIASLSRGDVADAWDGEGLLW